MGSRDIIYATTATLSSYCIKKVGHRALHFLSSNFSHKNLIQFYDEKIIFVKRYIWTEGDRKPAKGLL